MVWQSVSSGGKSIAKFNHWPDPWKHTIKNLDVLACEDTWQAWASIWRSETYEWLFGAFIPSPREIERKTFTGSYKCGFYFGLKWKQPIDIIWEDAKTGDVLLEIAHPFVTALFMVWAAETALDALNRWTSVMYAQARCDANRNETLLRDAHSPMPNGVHSGGAAFAEVIWDPNNWGIKEDCSVNVLFNWPATCTAVGYIVAEGKTLTNVKIGMYNGEEVVSEQGLGDIHPGEVVAWSASGSIVGPGTLQPRISCTVSGGGIVPADFKCVRLTASQGDGVHPPPRLAIPTPQVPCPFMETGIPLPMPAN